MGKREKREKKHQQRFQKQLETSLSTTNCKCGICKRSVTIYALNGYAICTCGNTVYREKRQ